MDRIASVRRIVATALTTHGPQIAGALGLTVLGLIVLPFDGPGARFIIGVICGIIGTSLGRRVAARLSGSNR
jgi:hypothetical protein